MLLLTTNGRDAGLIKAMNLSGHKSQVACVALSSDNRRAATASKDGILKVRWCSADWVAAWKAGVASQQQL